MTETKKVTFSKEHLVKDLRALGLQPGDIINIKCSIKAIGAMEGGAETLIEALLEVVGPEGTIMTDAFVTAGKRRFFHKGVPDNHTPSYAGALANAMIKHKNAYRSKHPIQKFSVIGKMAKELAENHDHTAYAYDILRIISSKNGKNLKIGPEEKVLGVGTTHVAIGMLNYKQKRKPEGAYYRDNNGKLHWFKINWAGGCAEGFRKFDPIYERTKGCVLARGKIGNADAKLTSMKDTLELELNILKKDPAFFLCENKDCYSCRYTWEFTKNSLLKIFFRYLFGLEVKKCFRLFQIAFYYQFQPIDKIKY